MVIPQDPIELSYDLKELKDLYLRTLNLIYGTKLNDEDSDNGVYRFRRLVTSRCCMSPKTNVRH